MTKSLLTATAAGVSGLAIGAFVGYKVAERRLSAQFDERLEKETAEMRTFYKAVPTKKFATPEEAVKELIPQNTQNILTAYQGSEVPKVAYNKIVKDIPDDPKPEDFEPFEGTESDQEVIVKNIFQTERDPNKPYLISEEEFNQNDGEFNQINLMYYQKDDVLTDLHEDVVENAKETIGPDFKVNFGYKAEENYVHVRNEKLQLDFEIVLHEGSYLEDVLGMDAPAERPSGRG